MTKARAREIARVVRAAQGNRVVAARTLGVSDTALARWIKTARSLGIIVADPKPRGVIAEASDDELREFWTTYERLGYNATDTGEALGLEETAVRRRVKAVQDRLGVERRPLGQVSARKAKRRALPPKNEIKRYLLTCAQNNTLPHLSTWATLVNLAEYWGAEIKVSTFTYSPLDTVEKRGSTKNFGRKEGDRWYASEFEPYICDEFEELAPGLVWCGHANTLPTASDPLAGTESMNGRASGVWPHTTIQMRSIATMKGDPAKFNYTTGAVTLRNYLQKRAGIRGEFHHAFGALLVEVTSDGSWWCRQLNADSEGTIHDLGIVATPEGVFEADGVEAIVCGDIHAATAAPEIVEATWGKGRMVDQLRPSLQVLHDVLDFESRSHHDRRDPHKQFEKYVRGTDSVHAEINGVGLFLRRAKRDFARSVVVCSNHDRHLDRWLKETDWRDDLPNAEFYIAAQAAMLSAIRNNKPFSALEWAVGYCGHADAAEFNPLDKSLVILKQHGGGGIELGLHGDLGPNGARGTPRNLSKLGRKVVIGDKHSPGIFDGCYVAGVTGSLDMGYNTGPSSWAHAHVVVYPNAKRQVVVFWKGAYSADDYLANR